MSCKAVVIASGRGQRRLDPSASIPNSLRELPGLGQVLAWNLASLKSSELRHVSLVAGYHVEKLLALEPGSRVFFHEGWEREGDVGALLAARPALSGRVLIASDRCVFRVEAVERVQARMDVCDVVVAWVPDRKGRDVALLALSPRATEELVDVLGELPRDADLPAIAEALALRDLATRGLSVDLAACPVRERSELARFVFGTKAETLDRLRSVLRSGRILPQVRFTVREWKQDPDGALERIAVELGRGLLVVRSAARGEDSWTDSQAGVFESVLGVKGDDEADVRAAIDRVIRSFATPEGIGLEHQVLVQPSLRSECAGVLLTRQPADGAPYYTINLDQSSRTDGVTGGRESCLTTYHVPRNVSLDRVRDERVRRLIECTREIETRVGHEELDVELAFEPDGGLAILQVRPLARSAGFELADEDLYAELDLAREQIARHLEPIEGLAGRRSLLGTMPDWNPAEIIGVAPRPLDLSLYRHAITDRVWAEARRDLGYADATAEPLVVGIGGRPYVRVQASFHSLLPAELDLDVRDRIVTAALGYLAAHPRLHDKIEFEVLPTCADFALDRFEERLIPFGVKQSDLRACQAAHAALTGRMVRGEVGGIEQELERLARLETRRQERMRSPVRDPWARLERVRQLLVELRSLGTRPFAVLARHAFVAIALLESLSRRGILRPSFCEELMASLPNVASGLSARLERVHAGRESLEAFLADAGHLRPGTYDVLSPTYAQGSAVYFGRASTGELPGSRASAQADLSGELLRAGSAIEGLARSMSLELTVDQLHTFVCAAIPAREAAKFEFTRTLSTILDELATFGDELGLDRETLSHLPIDALLQVLIHSPHAAQVDDWRRLAGLNAKRMQLTRAIRLPDLIRGPEDTDVVEITAARPNFVTRRCVTAPCVVVDEPGWEDRDLAGAILLCRRADPGYDWIFSHGIAGLVTQHGGVASHMAIRAAEFRLPAAIGCGELLYGRLRNGRRIRLDCASEQIQVAS